MSYNNENYYKLREEYAEKPLRAIERADARKTELRQKVEGYAELDDILAATASRIMGAAMEGREGLDARIAKIKRETAETRDAMRILLKSAGYPADYADVHYACKNVCLLSAGADPARLRVGGCRAVDRHAVF